MTRRDVAEDTSGGGGGGEASEAVGVGYYTLLAPVSVAAKLWSALSSCPSVVIAGEEDWQTLRIKQGIAPSSSTINSSSYCSGSGSGHW